MEAKKAEIIETVKSNPKWVLFLFTIFVTGISYLVAGHIFAEKPVVVPFDNRLYGFFTGKEHQKLIQQLDKYNKAILVGNRKDGLYLFIDYYTSLKIKDGYVVKKRLFQAGQDLKYQKFPLLAIGYHFVHLQFFSQEALPTLWLIETRSVLNTSDLDHIATFAEAHPNHKFLIAVNETKPGKDTSTFKKLTFTRPTESEFTGLIKDQHLSKVITKNIINYHNSSFNFLSHLVNSENITSVWASYFSEETDNLNKLIANSSKASKILEALCKDGSHASKQVKDISPYNGAIVHQGKSYYWSSLKHIYAYSNAVGKLCTTEAKFVPAPQQPIIIVEEVKVEVPAPVVAEEKKQKAKVEPIAQKKATKKKEAKKKAK